MAHRVTVLVREAARVVRCADDGPFSSEGGAYRSSGWGSGKHNLMGVTGSPSGERGGASPSPSSVKKSSVRATLSSSHDDRGAGAACTASGCTRCGRRTSGRVPMLPSMPSAVARCGAARPHGPRRSLDARPDFELFRERRGSALALPTLLIEGVRSLGRYG